MKKITSLLLIAAMEISLLTGCGDKPQSAETNTETQSETNAETMAATETEKTTKAESEVKGDEEGKIHHIEINIKDYGSISVELDAESAPITVENFLKLAGEGFYDGLTFHRIISGFMIQGGDPEGTGMGGSDETIKGEFSSNGVENALSHTRGTISMARSQAPDSASSQFFIVHEDSTFLDGEYAAFGHVTEGMDVVDKICDAVQAEEGSGSVVKEDQPVIESIVVID